MEASRKPEVHSDHCQRAVPCNASNCAARRLSSQTVMQAAEFAKQQVSIIPVESVKPRWVLSDTSLRYAGRAVMNY